MTSKTCDGPLQTCDPQMISCYVDGELATDIRVRVEDHLKECPSCRKALEAYGAVASLLRWGAATALPQAHLKGLEDRVIGKLNKRESLGRPVFKGLWFPGRLVIPAAAVLGVLLLLLIQTGPPAPTDAPSAIVDSFSGNVSSVMILETPDTHQTIIWFEETVLDGDDRDEVLDTRKRFNGRPFSGMASRDAGWCRT